MSNSLIEPYKLSSWAKTRGFTHRFVYVGPSMSPTFQSGDFLYLRSAPVKLHKGDVIVFADTKSNGFVVHRIVSTSPIGLVTRGDQNRFCDPPVPLDQVIGKVDLVENKAGINPVIHGLRGLWSARISYLVFQLYALFRQLFWIPYRLFRISGLVSTFWRPNIVKLHLQNADGSLIKYIHKHRTVAVWNPFLQKFDCHKPFDLVITHPEI
ncbi:MAG: signal peptidase I [Anaerolineales bacterium]